MRLLAVAAALEFELPTADLRKRDVLDALLASKRSSLKLILSALTRRELLAVCRASGLEGSGGEKPTLVARLIAWDEHLLTGGTSDGGSSQIVSWESVVLPQPELPQNWQPDPEEQLDQRKLEAHLWEAANILRGKIDSSDFKHYIFGLLFYKRLSDVWEEEYEQRLATTGDPLEAADPHEHRFQIPEEFLWKNVCHQRSHIGQHLNHAFWAIEMANSRLIDVFQDVDFENTDRFPDATLRLLIHHFEKYRLRNCDVEPDILGNAYEYLIAQFADDAGKKGGEFYTPKRVVRLIVECLRPEEGMRIYDPACGSGGMLLEAAHYLKRYGLDPGTLRLYGQEMNLNTWAICKMNLFLHGIDDASVKRGDTLRDPKHHDDEGGLRVFDRVLANPPFSLKNWGHEVWRRGDPFNRECYGCPPPSYGDLAFVQHMLASLAPDGMLGVVVPHGVLFRGGAEGRIRRGLLENDLIEAVIGLPPNLFYGTAISACVMILHRGKTGAKHRRLAVIDGSREMRTGKNKNRLSEENVERLARAFHAFRDEPHFARVVDLEEIIANDYNLTINRYVSTPPPEGEKPVDVAAELRELRRLQARRDAAEDQMASLLAELGYDA